MSMIIVIFCLLDHWWWNVLSKIFGDILVQ